MVRLVVGAMLGIVLIGCGVAAPAATGPGSGQSPGAPSTSAVTLAPVATAAPPTAEPVSSAPPTIAPPTLAPVTVPPQPTPLPATTGPTGTTSFHVVITDGPRAGTYDVSSSGPADCSYLPNLSKWNAVYLGPPPLTFIQTDTSEDLPSLLVSFDRDLPTFTSIRSIGDVTTDVDDRGSEVTLTIVSDENEVDFGDGSPSVDIGPIELTVECSAPFRYPT